MTVAALLSTAAERWGERVFVVDDAGESWSFAATEERARRAAAKFGYSVCSPDRRSPSAAAKGAASTRAKASS